jgi:hypothetical protein
MVVLLFWGRGLFVGGVVAALLSVTPALILSQLPRAIGDSFYGLVAELLLVMVTPLALLFASAGAILLLIALFRHLRGRGAG